MVREHHHFTIWPTSQSVQMHLSEQGQQQKQTDNDHCTKHNNLHKPTTTKWYWIGPMEESHQYDDPQARRLLPHKQAKSNTHIRSRLQWHSRHFVQPQGTV